MSPSLPDPHTPCKLPRPQTLHFALAEGGDSCACSGNCGSTECGRRKSVSYRQRHAGSAPLRICEKVRGKMAPFRPFQKNALCKMSKHISTQSGQAPPPNSICNFPAAWLAESRRNPPRENRMHRSSCAVEGRPSRESKLGVQAARGPKKPNASRQARRPGGKYCDDCSCGVTECSRQRNGKGFSRWCGRHESILREGKCAVVGGGTARRPGGVAAASSACGEEQLVAGGARVGGHLCLRCSVRG